MISQSTIDEVFETARIEEVVGDFVSLKKRGANFIGLCPFHNEKTPSFNVSPAKGIYKCFGCGAAGNSVKFVMELEKLSFPESIKYLAKKYNINVEENEIAPEYKEEQHERESMYLLNQWAMDFFRNQLIETEEGKAIALSYFKERGFTDSTIETFGLGYHPNEFAAFYKEAIKAGYKEEFLLKTGLVIEKEGNFFDRFRGRVMFPIRQPSGKVLGFGGRILGDNKKIAKYLNSPESEVYHKSAVLYGLYEGRKAISTENEALLVEGYTDVISLYQAGLKNAVASSGTSLTTDQIRLLKRYTENIIMLYDGDSAGVKATFRGMDMIIEQGLNVKIVSLPEGEDPDSFAKSNTADYIKDYIRREAKNFVSYKTSILKKEADGDPLKIAEMIRDVVHTLALIPDNILRSVYIKECSVELDIDEQTLIFELNRQIRENQKKAAKAEFVSSEVAPSPEKPKGNVHIELTNTALDQENELLRILILYANDIVVLDNEGETDDEFIHCRIGDAIKYYLQEDELYPQERVNSKIYKFFSDTGEEDFPNESFFFKHEDEEISQRAIHLTSSQYQLSENWKDKHQIYISTEKETNKKMLLTAIYAFKFRRLQIILDEIDNKLSGELEDQELLELLEDKRRLLPAKLALAKQLSYVFV